MSTHSNGRRGWTVLFTLLFLAILGVVGVVLAAPAPAESPAEVSTQGEHLLSNTAVFTSTDYYFPFITNLFNAPTVFGVEMSNISNADRLDLVQQAGAYWVRKNGLLWSSVQPTQTGGYDWSAVSGLEFQLQNAHQAGLEIILIIRSTPAWAQLYPGTPCGPMKSEYFKDFGNFVAAAIQRYSGPPFYVRYYEIWNEPDVDPSLIDPTEVYGCWGDKTDDYYGGQFYGKMLKVIYPIAKAAGPNAQILIGGLLLDCDPRNPPNGSNCKPSKFLEGILLAGAKNSFDGVSFHAYDHYNSVDNTFGNPNWHSGRFFNEPDGVHQPVLVVKAQFLREVLAAYGASGKYLINTEVALLCGGALDPPGQPGCDANDTSPYEVMKTAYLAQAYASALSEGLLGNLWFTMRGWRNSGLIYSDLSPRPAYYAFDFSQDMLWNATYASEVTGYPDVKGYIFTRDVGNDLWILWVTNEVPQMITLPFTPAAIWDALGNPVAVTGTSVNLDTGPVYIEMP